MGCHTWFYKKVEVDHNTVKTHVVDRLKRNIDFYEKMISHREEIDSDLLEAYPEWTVECGQKHKVIVERQLRMVEQDLCKRAMYNRYTYNDEIVTCYINGKGFLVSSDELPHDLFRIGNYPTDKLFSFDETLKYLEDKKDKIYFPSVYITKEEAIKRLKDFWEKYPDGMIRFG